MRIFSLVFNMMCANGCQVHRLSIRQMHCIVAAGYRCSEKLLADIREPRTSIFLFWDKMPFSNVLNLHWCSVRFTTTLYINRWLNAASSISLAFRTGCGEVCTVITALNIQLVFWEITAERDLRQNKHVWVFFLQVWTRCTQTFSQCLLRAWQAHSKFYCWSDFFWHCLEFMCKRGLMRLNGRTEASSVRYAQIK